MNYPTDVHHSIYVYLNEQQYLSGTPIAIYRSLSVPRTGEILRIRLYAGNGQDWPKPGVIDVQVTGISYDVLNQHPFQNTMPWNLTSDNVDVFATPANEASKQFCKQWFGYEDEKQP